MKNKTNRNMQPFQAMQTQHGKLILNKFDELMPFWGVGSQIMRRGYYDMPEIDLTKQILTQHKEVFGDGVIALDCGANIGVHTIEWAQLMTGWGHVYAFEAQEFIYYALCGSIALNNCFNVTAKNVAIGKENGSINVPTVDYSRNSSFGSLEIKKRDNGEWIGQHIDYSNTYTVSLISLDSLNLERIDLLKVDVEGMEEDVFNGAEHSIIKFKPTIYFEHSKSDKNALHLFLNKNGYNLQYKGNNAVAIHQDSPISIDISHFEL
jgi:FkbM family methyltransferase